MGSLPKPLIGLLLGTVAFFAVWMVALKPSSSSSNGGSQGGVGQYQSAINKAHQAVTTSNQANAKLGAPTATTKAPAAKTAIAPAAKTATAAKAAPATKPAAKPAVPATKPAAKQADTVSVATGSQALKAAASGKIVLYSFWTPNVVDAVDHGITDHQQVVAVLFFNPAAADDRAMAAELGPSGRNQNVLAVAVPVSDLTKFAALTTKVPVVTSPTLVIVDRRGQATELAGYAGTDEIAQRIDDAIAAAPASK